MTATLVYLPGDGIGPEVGAVALQVMEAVQARFGVSYRVETHVIGGAAIDAAGEPLPEETRAALTRADAVLLGAVGGPRWDDAPVRPEAGLLAMRKALGVFANLRPVVPHPKVLDASPLKPDILKGTDLMVVRELTGGLYFGDKARDATRAHDTCVYTREEIERVVRRAADLARARSGRLTSVDKANVLETSRLWRAVTTEVMAAEYPDVSVEHLLVDAAAMHLLSRPSSFDVIVTENMFGDILTDEASMLAGSMGLLPSASLGTGSVGLYEPIHGSAPDIAGQGKANPLAMVLSVAMMLRYSFAREDAACAVEAAVHRCLDTGFVTADLGGSYSTDAVGRAVCEALKRDAPTAAAAI